MTGKTVIVVTCKDQEPYDAPDYVLQSYVKEGLNLQEAGTVVDAMALLKQRDVDSFAGVICPVGARFNDSEPFGGVAGMVLAAYCERASIPYVLCDDRSLTGETLECVESILGELNWYKLVEPTALRRRPDWLTALIQLRGQHVEAMS